MASTITYANVYSTGLGDAELSAGFERELVALRSRGAPRSCAHRIGGRSVDGGERFERADPSDPSRMVASGFTAGRELVDAAVADARRALPEWRRMAVAERVSLLRRTIGAIDARGVELAALLSEAAGEMNLVT